MLGISHQTALRHIAQSSVIHVSVFYWMCICRNRIKMSIWGLCGISNVVILIAVDFYPQ